MHILCTICSDLVNQAENIRVTKCGHVFHFHCLSQWIERSKSCPQCRNKVTDKCMFRLYPTISNEPSGDDVATLQSRHDDALLQLRQLKASCKEYTDKIASTEAEMKKNMGLLKACENKLESRDSTIAAMKEQLQYLKEQNRETQRIKEENESLKKNIQTLNGLQKVLNATSEEVEQMLEGYSDVRTVATFATALKRALCESESKKNDTRDRLQVVKQKLAAEKNIVADLQAKLAFAEERLTAKIRKIKSLRQKRKSDVLQESVEESPSSSEAKKMKPDLDVAIHLSDSCDTSINSMVTKIENADSPYLRLQQSSLALSALSLVRPSNPAKPLSDKTLKPSEYALLNSARNSIKKQETNQSSKTSIFQKKEPTKMTLSQENDQNLSLMNISYDGLGGHSKLETFPVPNPRPNFKSCLPKLSAKHKLKRPNPVGSQDIGKMLDKIREKETS
ncbi:E3 ubiquitin-protein ligase TRAIP [Maniola jurtina]|uniref:E3 ubiquitin-protein ligase TRAIP n=1 Tax=Maniola jurtina TaxID=191418 RepID=UPI001E68A256|nr:E3 ubiquitin-protein ligase TRAIP [Maniola jurtina]XP_045779201.1 E3 ubiquitin-protein ligase TRAIP [Maniola jurtina]